MQNRIRARLWMLSSLGLTLALAIGFSLPTASADDAAHPAPTTRRVPASRPVKPVAPDDSQRDVVLPTEPGDHRLKFRTHIGSRQVVLSYLLHFPPDYSQSRKPYPMLVFFHGIGECGTDLAGVYALGPMTKLKKDGGDATFAASCPFIVLCPQCPPRGETWNTDFIYKAAAQLVDQTIRKTHTDPDRVYATGLSMGGLGSWCVAEERPDLFAAIAPLSAMAWHPEQAGALLKYVSIWDVVGTNDDGRFTDGTRSMEKALADGKEVRRFTYMVGMGHEAWSPPYDNPPFYEWLLSRRRPTDPQKKQLDHQHAPPTTQPLPTTPGHYLLTYKTNVANQPVDLDYVLYLPKGYKSQGPASPAMMFLHEEDTIGPDYNDICVHGPDLALESKPQLQNSFPFVVISPKLPFKCDWQSDGIKQMLLDLLDHVSQGVNIDADRVSLTGINNGATGAWRLAADVKNRFCAIAPVITEGSFTPGDDTSSVITDIPGRVFLRDSEHGSIEQMQRMTKNARQDWAITKMPGDPNPIVDLPVYSDPQFLSWLEQQHRSTPKVSASAKP